MAPYLAAFLEASAAQGLSPRTVESRERLLKRFIAWCAERDLNRPQEITRPILERYRRHLYHYRKRNGEPLGFATQQQCLVAVKSFLNGSPRRTICSPTPPASWSCRESTAACPSSC